MAIIANYSVYDNGTVSYRRSVLNEHMELKIHFEKTSKYR